MEKLGHYRIEKQLGRGAMGVVYRAVDERLDRTVALKVLRLNLADDERAEYGARLQQEARSAARLNHPGIITMYDCGEEGGNAFLAMEYVEGKSLADLMERARLSVGRVVKVADQLFSALAYAHEHGVVHRDIKPANLMLTPDGRLKITDFGIAQLPASDLTRTGTLVGSPRHMSPEQVQGKKVDGRADLFSAGIVLYELLTAHKPFDGEHVASIAYRIMHETPNDLQSLNPDVPDELAAVVMRCLEKDPANRFQTAREARAAIRALAGKSSAPAAANGTQGEESDVSVVEAAAPVQPVASDTTNPGWKMVHPAGPKYNRLWIGAAAVMVALVVATALVRIRVPVQQVAGAEQPAKPEIMAPQGATGMLPPKPATSPVATPTHEGSTEPDALAEAPKPMPTPADIDREAARRAGTAKSPASPGVAKHAADEPKMPKPTKPAGPHKPLPIIPIPPGH